jgi:pyrrolidone-carboxylate peptidase
MSGPKAATRAAQPPQAARARTPAARATAPEHLGASSLGDVMGLQKQLGNRLAGALVQRQCTGCAGSGHKCAHCAEEEASAKGDSLTVNAARSPRAPTGSIAVPSLAREILEQSGEPIPDVARRDMEARLGTSFADVRVHTDARATHAAGEIDARAYTAGAHIVFGNGEFSPHTLEGRRLLAHELVHVVQQRHVGPGPRPGEATTIVPADDPSEREAERIAGEVTAVSAPPTAREPADARADAVGANGEAPGREHGGGDAGGADGAGEASTPPSAGHVQRVPFGEWWSRFVLGEGTFSDKELSDYLAFLNAGSIEDHYDSDNKARVIVGRWASAKMNIKMPPLRATLLIKEMQSGFTGDDDELAILEILEHTSNDDLKLIFTSIAVDDLNSDFQGDEWTLLQDFYRRRFKGGMAAMLKGVIEPVGEPLPLGVRRGEIPQQKISADDAKADQTANEPDEARCDVKHPENCPTYESWLHQFKNVPTFRASSGHTVLGDKPAPKDTATDLTKDPGERRPASVRKVGKGESRSYLPTDRFIDGPTEQWVRENLPENLLKAAYELPCDCADVAVILRHVWLAAHHRSEKEGPWVLGSEAGEARQEDIRTLILMEVGPGVERFLNPYTNEKGEPLRKYSDLEPLLHAGDVLVWDHEIGSGHVQTILDVVRDETGRITSMAVLQGNQPIDSDTAQEIARDDPKEQAQKKPSERKPTPSVSELRAAPGRRIERSTAHVPLPEHRDEPVWGWHDEQRTFLVAAGPPSSAPRPKAQVVKGKKLPQRPTDWVTSLRGATLQNIDAVFEGMLMELRSAVEGKSGATDEEARRLGQAAGERLAALLAKSGDLQEGGSSFYRMRRMRAQIHAVRQTACVKGTSEAAADDKTARRCSLTPFDALDRAFTEAARGISGVDFDRKRAKDERSVNVLLTGFDPFNATDVDRPPRPGDWNPSGAAVRELDGQTVPVDGKVKAAVEGVILPVSFPEFRAGLVESIVDQHRDADAILTVSLDPNLEPNDPVRLEEFAVGVHAGGSQQEEATPTAKGEPGKPSIFEARGDVSAIAADTAAKPKGGREIPEPDIGTTVTLDFATVATADAALAALGETAQNKTRVKVSSVTAVRQIASTMRPEGAAGGTRFSFTAKGQSFSASLVSGPGGSFLSNEVSFRVLRRLSEQGRADTVSFHTHVPPGTADSAEIPQETATAAERKTRDSALAKARDVLAHLVDTLKHLIVAVGKRVGLGKTGTKP